MDRVWCYAGYHFGHNGHVSGAEVNLCARLFGFWFHSSVSGRAFGVTQAATLATVAAFATQRLYPEEGDGRAKPETEERSAELNLCAAKAAVVPKVIACVAPNALPETEG